MREGGLGGGGSRLAPKVGSHGQCDLPSSARLGVPTFGCLVSQAPELLTIPEPRQGAGEREIPPCLRVSTAHVLSGGVGGGWGKLLGGAWPSCFSSGAHRRWLRGGVRLIYRPLTCTLAEVDGHCAGLGSCHCVGPVSCSAQ